jgi:hypothetical protein
MRWLLVATLIGCGSAPAAPKSPSPQKAEKPPQDAFWSSTKSAEPEDDGPLVALATKRTYYVLATEEFGAECRGWTVEQSKAQDSDLAFLVDGDERIGFVNHGARLELRERTRSTRFGSDSTTCSGTFSVSVRDRDGGLDVSGARWFDRLDDCNAALESREKVATDLSACAWKPAANLQQQAAAQRRFEAMLRFGGTLFGIANDACAPVHATPERAGSNASSFHGELWSPLRDGKRRGKSGHGYQMQAHAMSIVLLGPRSSWDDGTGFGMLCGDELALSYGRDTVELAQTMYLSAASCRAALAKERAAASRLPVSGEDDAREISSSARPHLGGC